jgi:RNA polymerase sigma factor (sigma-70 family)
MNEQMTPVELYEKHKNLAIQTVLRKYPDYKAIAKNIGIEPDDFFQYAREGLWKAALEFNPEKGNRKFKNFAIYNIRWNLEDWIKKENRVITFKGIGRTGIDCGYVRENLKFLSFDAASSKDNDSDDNTNHEKFGDDYNLEGEVFGKVLIDMINNQYPKRTVDMIKLRMQGYTYEKIGEEFGGLSRERVRQIFAKVKKELQGVI